MKSARLALSFSFLVLSLPVWADQGGHQQKRTRATAQVMEFESEKIAALSKQYKGTAEQKEELLAELKAYLKQKVTQSDKKILLKFSSTWCGPCKAINPEIERFAVRKAAEYEVISIEVSNYLGLTKALGLKEMPAVYELTRGAETSLRDSEDLIGPITSVERILEYLKSK